MINPCSYSKLSLTDSKNSMNRSMKDLKQLKINDIKVMKNQN